MASPSPRPASQGVCVVHAEGYAAFFTLPIHNFWLYLESPLNLRLMRSIDAQFLETPFYGSRQMQRWLRRQGDTVSRKRVRRLLRLLGLHAVFQRPRTSQSHPGHRIYPYLLRDLAITRPNHVWCTDVTYIPLQRGFLYLVAVMDWASRTGLAWRLSNTLEASFCVAAWA